MEKGCFLYFLYNHSTHQNQIQARDLGEYLKMSTLIQTHWHLFHRRFLPQLHTVLFAFQFSGLGKAYSPAYLGIQRNILHTQN